LVSDYSPMIPDRGDARPPGEETTVGSFDVEKRDAQSMRLTNREN